MPPPYDPRDRVKPPQQPVIGWCAVGFGVLGILGPTIVFTPIALVCSVIALFSGQAVMAFIGLLLVAAGIITSPMLMGILSIGVFFTVYDFSDILQMLMDMIGLEEGAPDETRQI